MSLIPITLVLGRPEAVRLALLRRWLQTPALADTLLLADAAIGAALAHPLFAPVRKTEAPAASGLQSVCACCVPQRGLASALRESTWRFARGGVRQFARVVVDSAALDVTPVMRTLLTDAAVTVRYRLTRVVAVADPGEPPWVLDAAAASLWAAADTLVTPAHVSPAARAWLAQIAPTAQLAAHDACLPEADAQTSTSPAAQAWLAQTHPADPF